MFESLIYESLRNRKTNLVFTEGESRRIGRVYIPDYIFQAMREGIHIRIDASLESRVNNIYRDYVKDTDGELILALERLRKYIGDKNINEYEKLIKEGEYKKVIEDLMVKYYDPLYGYKKKNYQGIFKNENPAKTAKEIIQWAKNLK